MQHECNSYCQDGALMIDTNGKKYESKVNKFAEKEEVNPLYEDTHVGAVATI